MKKNFLIFGTLITLLSITAFTYKKWGRSNIFDEKPQNKPKTVFFNKYLFNALDNAIYLNLGPGSNFTVSKDEISNATPLPTFLDKFIKLVDESSENISSISIAKLKEDMTPDKSLVGNGNAFNGSQINLLKSLDYQDIVFMNITIKKLHPKTGKSITRGLTYYFTVVPEKLAEYSLGNEAFIDFIRENTKKETLNINKNKLDSGSIRFIVTENGEISEIKLINKSGLKVLDDKLPELLNSLPGKWVPASNGSGKSMSQEMFFTFGNQGC